jgi:hypothetical protein
MTSRLIHFEVFDLVQDAELIDGVPHTVDVRKLDVIVRRVSN